MYKVPQRTNQKGIVKIASKIPFNLVPQCIMVQLLEAWNGYGVLISPPHHVMGLQPISVNKIC